MTQRHYIDSIRDDRDLDPQFKSLLRHHWLEEAQHAKLDTMMVEALARDLSDQEITEAFDEYLEMGGFLDNGMQQQTLFELEAFEAATGRVLTEDEREKYIEIQHQANRWTFIGTGITHPRFLETVGALSDADQKRLETVGPVFC